MYPLELLALGLAQWVGGQTACSAIHSDCQSAISNHGTTEPTSEYYQVDQIHLPPFRVPTFKVKAHQDDSHPFTDLELPEQGNVLANDVAMGYTHYPHVELKIFNLTLRDVLVCGKRRRVTWGAAKGSRETSGIAPLQSRSSIVLEVRSARYWKTRVIRL